MTEENVALDAGLIEEVRARVAPDSRSVRSFIELAIRTSLEQTDAATRFRQTR